MKVKVFFFFLIFDRIDLPLSRIAQRRNPLLLCPTFLFEAVVEGDAFFLPLILLDSTIFSIP